MAEPGRGRSALALLLSTHPGPSVAVTAIVVVLGTSIGLEPWRIAVLGAAFLLGQFSVGLSNDWLDAERDRAVGRRDKPAAMGTVGVPAVRTAAWVSAVLAIVITLPLGIPATLAHLAFIASAWAYNLGLKSTPLSVAPYVVSFGLLPAVVTLSLQHPSVAAPWAFAAGALLGVAAHFANVLPDFDDDRNTGIRGLPHRMGRPASGLVTCGALVAASAIAAAGGGNALGWVAFALCVVIAAVCAYLVLARTPTRQLFQLIIAAALVTVISLALAGTELLA